ncbi:glycerol-3-phosphate 1-O-acyltransferase PlsB [Xanthomonas hortorum pv. cynarae]|uniref:glycerol-3-phosphate 1-O-acyltransferase PlsB n=1 Tax=Xanthomonas hortorum TaxID=56454 RepID=UPI000CEE6D6D|nr:glycerol-3-phosphate 1-O-acyltransferase PlsB [Xanthomonas hortorum]MCE4350894.1 glycerol-3-phosphate 1-O-acyltransferase PlsB [Xanthomonas hortorum pv. cynarae]PPU39299.1 glycerol-3-phosphate 1-O-acyltransferase [Xanthomonas hortorum pv. cynarae]CAD0358465.1 Glycerol-3-phosphate acyltransferase [Xanthomonas hortorum pv. cynarae]CAD0358471.1 Glycerol-3-phosphate acyltransferase [Xanthomonas hortorum pv. cynarae]
MTVMPEQNPLPFPDGQSAPPSAAAADLGATAAALPTAVPVPPDAAPSIAPAVAAARNAKRPWWARLLGRLADPWLSLTIEPDQPSRYDDGTPVVYVLEDYGLSSALILDKACREAGLPSPLVPLPGDPLQRKRAYLALSRRSSSNSLIPEQRGGKTHSDSLAKLLQAHRVRDDLDVHLVPVSIFVGRAPDKQSGWFAVLFSENWALVGRFRRLLAVLLNGRTTIVRFAPPISLRQTMAEGLPPERTLRKLQRVLRTHFRRIREAVIGPDLSTRRLLVDQVLAADSVREAIATQARRDNSKPVDAWRKAHAYAWEIAADYSSPVVRSASFLLTHVWNRIYAGVLVHHLDKLKQAAPGHEVVYVPSHRSHMDYLLLSYLLYERGIVPPHIVAGINLNLPVVGTLLRKGGAFFIRRSIRGNALYSAVLSEYVAQLVAGGYSIEYFVEGGRSRTGRLLQPKGGMIAMTLRAYLRQPRKPVLFQPVYIGYEKLMEGNSYLDELTGRPKEKESIWGLLWSIPKVLKQNYGQVVVNFGEPIALNDVLAKHAPEWDGQPLPDDEKPSWLAPAVDTLSTQIQTRINCAADVNPINLLALALLSTPKHAMGEADLIAQIELCKKLLAEMPYSDRVTVTPHTPARIITHAEEINVLTRVSHPLGDVLSVSGDTAVLLSYFRNNVLHLFTASSWVACCFQNNRRMSRAGLLRLGRTVYPFLQAELFLPWSEDRFAERIEQTIDMFVREGLLLNVADDDGGVLTRNTGQTDEVFRLRAIGHSLQQAFERYYIAISVLVKNGPGVLGAGELESLCQQAAQRLSLLYAPAAPEFFDKTLFRSFIQKLRELRLVWPDENSKLVFDERLDAWAKDAKFILGRELRHTIERVSPEAAKPDVVLPPAE